MKTDINGCSTCQAASEVEMFGEAYVDSDTERTVRNGKLSSTSIAVWCGPVDFKEAVDGVFASMRYKEI